MTTGAGTQLHDEMNRVIARRLRAALGIVLVAVVVYATAVHLLSVTTPVSVGVLNIGAAVLVGAVYWILRRPAVSARPVPFALLGVGLACSLRALGGIWYGDTLATAILCVVLALAAGATMPWGVRPQIAVSAMAAVAILANIYAVEGGLATLPVHLVASVATAFAVSVVLAYVLRRQAIELVEEHLQRRQAEEGLARLNAELEQRVVDRTAELAAATARLEQEALERQQATHELRESQKRLQDILDNAPAAIYLKDADGHYLLVNRRWETVTGMARAAVVGKCGHDVHPAAVADVLRANDMRVLAARRPLEFEETLPQDGELHTFLSVKFPLSDSAGAVAGVCGMSTDITARIRAEADLRRSEASLSAVVENTTEAIWSIDRNYQVTVLNSEARKRFRAQFGTDFDPRAGAANLPPDFWADLTGLYDRALAGEHTVAERTYVRPDGTHHILMSLHPIVDNGTITGATAFSEDITEVRRAEDQARQRQAELAHVLRLGTMGEMAAGLAHEINQPLGAIANYAQGCVRRMRARSIELPALLPIMEEIAGEALRAGEIIRRLRDLVRKETPQQEAVDLNGLVRESLRIIEPEARQNGIQVRLDLAPDLPIVTADGIQIEQVLLNLMRNGVEAVQATNNGERTLAIATRMADAADVEVAVRDSGVGVPDPPADVFAPFFSTKPNGLGMGLSISRSIIEAHGGRLSAARNAGPGSTFRFTLPLADTTRPH